MVESAEAGRDLHPRHTADLIGHEIAERELAAAFASDKLPHAWMICGPRGIGKATLAYRFARYVLAASDAPAGAGLAVAPDHPVFRRVAAQSHADLSTIERSWDDRRNRMREEIVIGDVRRLSQFFSRKPAEGAWRVAVVDVADDMNRNAANALLKTLEEPPLRGLILLVSHAPGRLLPTIRSRCRRLVLKPLTEEALVGLLGAQHPDFDDDHRLAVARLAEGSPGRALHLARQGGLAFFGELMEQLASLPDLDVASVHRFTDRLTRRGNEAAFETVAWLLRWWLARAIRNAAIGRAGPDIIVGEGAVAALLVRRSDLDRWVEVWEKTGALLAKVEDANLNRKQVVLGVFAALERVARRRSFPLSA